MLLSNTPTSPSKTITVMVRSCMARRRSGRTVSTVLKISQAELNKIAALSRVCEIHDLSEARCFASAESWGRNSGANDVHVTQVELVVYPSGIFYLTGEESSSDQEVDSHLITLLRLQNAFNSTEAGGTVVLGDLYALQAEPTMDLLPA